MEYRKYKDSIVDINATIHEKYEEVHIGSKHNFLTVVDIIQIPNRNEKTTICYCERGRVVYQEILSGERYVYFINAKRFAEIERTAI